MLHVFDGSKLHELWLVFGSLLKAAWVYVKVEQRLLCTRHNRGICATSCNWFGWSLKTLCQWHELDGDTDWYSGFAVFPKDGAYRWGDRVDAVWLGLSVRYATCHHQRQDPHHHSQLWDPVHYPTWKEQQSCVSSTDAKQCAHTQHKHGSFWNA